jgi:hypothetical protein
MVMAKPIASYLARFDVDEGVASSSFMIMPEPTIDPAEIIAAEREAAHNDGYEAGLAAGQEKADAERQEAEADFDAKLLSERERWAQDEAVRIDAALVAGFDVLTRDISHCAEQVLRPFVDVAMRQKAVVDLTDTLKRLGEDAPLLRVTGPVDLIDALRKCEALPQKIVDFQSGDQIDVKVVAQPTIIETRIGAWMQRLMGVAENTASV